MEKDFTRLEIYNLAEALLVKIYGLTRNFPQEELYGITSQIRRACLSICLNIAEGYGRYHYKEKIQFLYNSRGSLLETKSVILVASKLGYINKEKLSDLLKDLDNLGVKLNNYISYLKNRSKL